jgi:hypothetical protein
MASEILRGFLKDSMTGDAEVTHGPLHRTHNALVRSADA